MKHVQAILRLILLGLDCSLSACPKHVEVRSTLKIMLSYASVECHEESLLLLCKTQG